QILSITVLSGTEAWICPSATALSIARRSEFLLTGFLMLPPLTGCCETRGRLSAASLREDARWLCRESTASVTPVRGGNQRPRRAVGRLRDGVLRTRT